MVNNHMVWVPTENNKGDLYGEYHGQLNDLPTFRDLTFTKACEAVIIFPPRTAVRRDIH